MTRANESGKKTSKTDARSARMAEALRANLRRRKAQERQRGAPLPPGPRKGS